MNMLHRSCLRQYVRFAETLTSTKFLAEPLSKRALIKVQGAEVVPYLQGLITNDMNHLHTDGNPSMFAMFLNNSGRVLYDSIIYRTPDADTFIIECDREISNELRRHLRLFRVRRKINVDCLSTELTPWVVYNPLHNGDPPKPSMSNLDQRLITQDPRLKELGIRILQPAGSKLNDVEKIFPDVELEQPTSYEYSKHRYIYGVGEGVVDHPPGKCFPLEANCDFLHGVSFQKGCYVGQELTARVYHTGVIRKRLMPIKLTSNPDLKVTTVQTQAGATVGTIRGISQNYALALLRIEKVLNGQELMVDGDSCKTYKPNWWPKELPVRPSMRSD